MSIPLIKKIAKDTATPFIVVERVWNQVQTHTTDLDLLCSITSRMVALKENNSFDAFLKKEKIISRLIEEAKSKAVDFDGKLIFLNLGNLKTAIKKLENPDITSVKMKNGKTLEVTYKNESVYKNFLIKAMKQILPDVNLNVTVESPKNYLVTIHDDHSFLTGLKESYEDEVSTEPIIEGIMEDIYDYLEKNKIPDRLTATPTNPALGGMQFVSSRGVQIEQNARTSGDKYSSGVALALLVKIGTSNKANVYDDILKIFARNTSGFKFKNSDKSLYNSLYKDSGTNFSTIGIREYSPEDDELIRESCREERELLDAPHSLEPKEWPVKTSLEEVDEKELKRGTEIELARTQNADSAKQVAKYNLQLNPNYYKISNPVAEKPTKKEKKIKESTGELSNLKPLNEIEIKNIRKFFKKLGMNIGLMAPDGSESLYFVSATDALDMWNYDNIDPKDDNIYGFAYIEFENENNRFDVKNTSKGLEYFTSSKEADQPTKVYKHSELNKLLMDIKKQYSKSFVTTKEEGEGGDMFSHLSGKEREEAQNKYFKGFRLESSEELGIPETPAPDKERIEAYGVKGMKSLQWRKKFKNAEALRKWAEENSAEVYGFRKLEDGE